MRYYGFELGTNTEKIKENAKIELRHSNFYKMRLVGLEPTRLPTGT